MNEVTELFLTSIGLGPLMKNQPKPTDEWHGQIHDDREHDGEPTGEWTATTVREILDALGFRSDIHPHHAIADAHNAQIAAAYQKGYEDGNNARSSG